MTKKKILLVDDEPKFTQLVRLNLENTGAYEVAEVNSASLVVKTAEKVHPDLILLDVMMPVMSGGDVEALLKVHPTLKNVPILYLTAAVTQVEAGGQDYHCGRRLFLAKPITLAALLAAIKTTLRQQ